MSKAVITKIAATAVLAGSALLGLVSAANANPAPHQNIQQQQQQPVQQQPIQQQQNNLEVAKQNARNTVYSLVYLPQFAKDFYINQINNATTAEAAYSIANQAYANDTQISRTLPVPLSS